MTDANQVHINELARELEVKAKAIIDLLPAFGVTEKKTHSSSIPVDVAEKVRKHFEGMADAEAQAEAAAKAEQEAKEAAAKAARGLVRAPAPGRPMRPAQWAPAAPAKGPIAPARAVPPATQPPAPAVARPVAPAGTQPPVARPPAGVPAAPQGKSLSSHPGTPTGTAPQLAAAHARVSRSFFQSTAEDVVASVEAVSG